MTRWEYLIANIQQSRVTWVNGSWNGSLQPTEANAMESCPDISQWLSAVGGEGWELTAVASIPTQSNTTLQHLYLRRPLP